MAFMDFFKKEEQDQFDPLQDLVLSKLKVGFYLDYDLKTWEVTRKYKYDYGDGYVSVEWELTSGREKVYLEFSDDEEVTWTVARKIPIGAVGANVRKEIMENDDPPEQLTYKDKTYYLDESAPGKMYEDGEDTAREFIKWEFIDEDEENFITIEQWGESEFEASTGTYVEEYQFENILPGITE